nr:hypothetical protein [Pelagicoccus sp. SDUM812002]
MAKAVIERTGFQVGSSAAKFAEDFSKHTATVKATIPESQPPCLRSRPRLEASLRLSRSRRTGQPLPRSNNREEFWELLKGTLPNTGSTLAMKKPKVLSEAAPLPDLGPEASSSTSAP